MERSATVRVTPWVFRDGSGDPWISTGRDRGSSGRSGTGMGKLRDVRDGSRDPLGYPNWVGGPSVKPRMDRGTLGEVRDG